MPSVPLLQVFAKAAPKARSKAADALKGIEQPGKSPPDQQNGTNRGYHHVRRHVLHRYLLPQRGIQAPATLPQSCYPRKSSHLRIPSSSMKGVMCAYSVVVIAITLCPRMAPTTG